MTLVRSVGDGTVTVVVPPRVWRRLQHTAVDNDRSTVAELLLAIGGHCDREAIRCAPREASCPAESV